MKVAGFFARRLGGLMFVLWGMSLLVFLVMWLLPGGSALSLLGPYANEARVAELERSLGLEGSLAERYLRWFSAVLRGDLGRSYSLDRPVIDVVIERLGPTLLLAGAALIVGSLLGLLAGSVAARYRGMLSDRALTVASVLGVSIPAFWLGMLLMLAVSVGLGWLPVSGMRTAHAPGGSWLDIARHLVLPTLSLALVIGGVTARLMRAEMLEALSSAYVKMARAKGLPEELVAYRHAFRSALSRMIPVLGLQAGFALGGAAYVETVFQWPGLGRLLVSSILSRDLLLAQGAVLVVATTYVLINFTADLVQRFVDPRIR